MKKKHMIWVLSLIVSILSLFSCKSLNVKRRYSTVEHPYKEHQDLSGKKISATCKEHLESAGELKEKIIKSDSKSLLQTLNTYNDVLTHLDSAMSQAGLFSQVHPDKEIRDNAEKCEQEVSRFITELSLDKDLYNILNNTNPNGLDKEAKRLLDHTLRDFRRSGVDQSDEVRNKIKDLKAQLVSLGQEFSQNIRDDRFIIELDSINDLAGLPKDYIDNHQPNSNGKIEISTDYPDYIPFMQYAKSDKWRKKLRFKYLNRGQKNEAVLKSLIKKRNELAKLLNYSSYADYVVEDKMIKEAKAIHEFVDKISNIAQKGADLEYKELITFKKQWDKSATTIHGYESAYIEEAFKSNKFKFTSQEVRPYFAYEKVRDGLLKVTSKLFDISYEKVTDAQVWHEDVATYDVYDNKQKLGRIYLDMHPREGKYKHAAQFTVVSGLKDRQYAEGALVCNFPNPKDGLALMEHRQVVTMFHEFGHLLHHIFAGKQKWISFSGVATEWDFVEAPSQFLEEWAWAPEVLSMFAAHYQTGEIIPESLVNKMRSADEFGKAIHARQQMFYAALSADYYDKDPSSFDLLDLMKKLQGKYSYFPYEEGTYFYHSFGHLDGYSAMYYTYMWSLSLAKDLFEPFKGAGMFDKDLAKKYKESILTPGGSKDAKELVEEFLGRPFKFDAFENWLRSETV